MVFYRITTTGTLNGDVQEPEVLLADSEGCANDLLERITGTRLGYGYSLDRAVTVSGSHDGYSYSTTVEPVETDATDVPCDSVDCPSGGE